MKLYFDKTELSLQTLKLTQGLLTTLALNRLDVNCLQPLWVSSSAVEGVTEGAEVLFCRAWAKLTGVAFDGDVEVFYKHFKFPLYAHENRVALTLLIKELYDRDVEPVIESNAKPKCKNGKKRG